MVSNVSSSRLGAFGGNPRQLVVKIAERPAVIDVRYAAVAAFLAFALSQSARHQFNCF